MATNDFPRYNVLSVRVNEVELAAIHLICDKYDVSEGKAARFLMFGDEETLKGKDPKKS
jgi:hypothetical protein